MSAAKVMLIDLSMHTGLSRHASLEKLLEMSTFRSHRTVSRPSTYESLRPKSPRSPQSPSSPVINLNSSSPFGTPKKKKRVVFADDKGLPLTAVKIFESDDQNSNVEEPSSPVITQTESPVQSKVPRLRLGFSQPSADLPSFLESLKKTLVRLESCSLIYGSLFGKVRVCNVSPEKAVHIRITYDSWKSHQDFPCTPIQQKNENPETELFVFNVPIPFCPNTQDRLEFYMVFRPGSGNMLLLDNNRGQNYRILVEDEEVQPVEKKPLRPYNFLPVNLRNGSSLYKSPSFSSIISSKNRIKSLIRQENIIPKGYFTPDFNNAVKSILA